VFHVGSVTKPWTATLVMQLVDEGRVDLDAPVAGFLPGFAVADPAATAVITARHLLSHTGGFAGDVLLLKLGLLRARRAGRGAARHDLEERRALAVGRPARCPSDSFFRG
jgi:CubicO group peptidase (beta-lactamase class C family)